MAKALPPFDEADVARRASRLLTAFFTSRDPKLQRTVLDQAFQGLRHDPRSLLETGGPAASFAGECVSKLLAYGCTDQGRHSLARLLEVIREDFLGANPHPDYIDLPRLLDRLCALPSREDEHAYLDRLLADIQRKAALYAPLRGLAQVKARADGGPLRGAWDDLAPLRHLRRPSATQQPMESRDFGDILTAFGQVKRAALAGPARRRQDHHAEQAGRRFGAAGEGGCRRAAPAPGQPGRLDGRGAAARFSGQPSAGDRLGAERPERREAGGAPPGRSQRNPYPTAPGESPTGARPDRQAGERHPGLCLLPGGRLRGRVGPRPRHPDATTAVATPGSRRPASLASLAVRRRWAGARRTPVLATRGRSGAGRGAGDLVGGRGGRGTVLDCGRHSAGTTPTSTGRPLAKRITCGDSTSAIRAV